MTKKLTEKQKCVNKFKALFEKEFGEKSSLAHTPETINVEVALKGRAWESIEPDVIELMKQTGLSKYFEVGGAGTGFGMRDISLYAIEE